MWTQPNTGNSNRDSKKSTRRNLLAAAAVVSTTVLAGCSSAAGTSTDEASTSEQSADSAEKAHEPEPDPPASPDAVVRKYLTALTEGNFHEAEELVIGIQAQRVSESYVQEMAERATDAEIEELHVEEVDGDMATVVATVSADTGVMQKFQETQFLLARWEGEWFIENAIY